VLLRLVSVRSSVRPIVQMLDPLVHDEGQEGLRCDVEIQVELRLRKNVRKITHFAIRGFAARREECEGEKEELQDAVDEVLTEWAKTGIVTWSAPERRLNQLSQGRSKKKNGSPIFEWNDAMSSMHGHGMGVWLGSEWMRAAKRPVTGSPTTGHRVTDDRSPGH